MATRLHAVSGIMCPPTPRAALAWPGIDSSRQISCKTLMKSFQIFIINIHIIRTVRGYPQTRPKLFKSRSYYETMIYNATDVATYNINVHVRQLRKKMVLYPTRLEVVWLHWIYRDVFVIVFGNSGVIARIFYCYFLFLIFCFQNNFFWLI